MSSMASSAQIGMGSHRKLGASLQPQAVFKGPLLSLQPDMLLVHQHCLYPSASTILSASHMQGILLQQGAGEWHRVGSSPGHPVH